MDPSQQSPGTTVTFPDGSTSSVAPEQLHAALTEGQGQISRKMSFPDGSQSWVPLNNVHKAITEGQGQFADFGDQQPSARETGADSITNDTSGFKPDDSGGGFLQHLWNNINPKNIAAGAVKLLENPSGAYSSDEAQRVTQLDQARKRLAAPPVLDQPGFTGKLKALANKADAAVQAGAAMIPFAGTAFNNAATEGEQGHTSAALGDATGLGLTLAAPDLIKAAPEVAGAAADVPGAAADAVSNSPVGRVASTMKNAVTVSPELKTAASVPVRSAADIQTAAVPEVTARIGEVIDDTAAQVQDAQGKPVDTSGISGLSDKAAYAGDSYKQAGQRVYSQLDDLAKQVTGKDWAFQKLTSDVNKLNEIIDDPETTAADRVDAQTRLKDSQANLDQFTKAAEQAGIPNVKGAIAQGNKLYSTGLSLEETARGIAKNEKIVINPDGSITRVLKPNKLPLDAAIRQVTDSARPRGHVLAQAVGESGAGEMQRASADAATKIAQDTKASNASRAAQKQIDVIRSRQAKIAAGAAALVGGKFAYGKARNAYSTLHGH